MTLLLLVAAWAGPPTVEVREVVHASAHRGGDERYVAWIPADGGEAMPVLYLLHGAWGSWRDWREHAGERLADLADAHDLVIVTPDGEEFGWWADTAGARVESYLLEELIPHVESTLPVAPGRRGIAGLSMGGNGALVLALRHGGSFASASSMSGIVDPTQHPTQWHLPEAFGPYASARDTWREHSATWLLRRASAPLPVLLTVSSGDRWSVDENRALHHELLGRGVEHGWREDPGDHDWAYWSAVVEHHVAFHAEHLAGD